MSKKMDARLIWVKVSVVKKKLYLIFDNPLYMGASPASRGSPLIAKVREKWMLGLYGLKCQWLKISD